MRGSACYFRMSSAIHSGKCSVTSPDRALANLVHPITRDRNSLHQDLIYIDFTVSLAA